MYPRTFDYVAPSSLDEAYSALGDDSKVMAGGMSLIPLMKMRLFSPGLVVDIGRIGGLDPIDDSGDHIEIGALVRQATTASSGVGTANAEAAANAAPIMAENFIR